MDYLIKGETLTEIANAIRGKSQITEPIKVEDFADKINNLTPSVSARILCKDLTSDGNAYATKNGVVVNGAWVGNQYYISGFNTMGTWLVTYSSGEASNTVSVLIDEDIDYEIDCSPYLALYWLGDLCTNVTGGWETPNATVGNYIAYAPTYEADNIAYTHQNVGSKYGVMVAGPINAIQPNKYSKICVEYQSDRANANSRFKIMAPNKHIFNDTALIEFPFDISLERTVARFDISSLNQEFIPYIFDNQGSTTTYAHIYKVWLEY